MEMCIMTPGTIFMVSLCFKVYEAKKKPLWEAYEAKRKDLWEAYNAKVKPLWEAYDAKVRPLWDDYETKLYNLYEQYWLLVHIASNRANNWINIESIISAH